MRNLPPRLRHRHGRKTRRRRYRRRLPTGRPAAPRHERTRRPSPTRRALRFRPFRRLPTTTRPTLPRPSSRRARRPSRRRGEETGRGRAERSAQGDRRGAGRGAVWRRKDCRGVPGEDRSEVVSRPVLRHPPGGPSPLYPAFATQYATRRTGRTGRCGSSPATSSSVATGRSRGSRRTGRTTRSCSPRRARSVAPPLWASGGGTTSCGPRRLRKTTTSPSGSPVPDQHVEAAAKTDRFRASKRRDLPAGGTRRGSRSRLMAHLMPAQAAPPPTSPGRAGASDLSIVRRLGTGRFDRDFGSFVGILFGTESIRTAMQTRRTLSDSATLEVAEQPLPEPLSPLPVNVPFVAQAAEIEGVAGHVPEECFYLRCGTVADYFWLRNLMMSWGGSYDHLISMQAQDYEIRPRLERQLALPSDRQFRQELETARLRHGPGRHRHLLPRRRGDRSPLGGLRSRIWKRLSAGSASGLCAARLKPSTARWSSASAGPRSCPRPTMSSARSTRSTATITWSPRLPIWCSGSSRRAKAGGRSPTCGNSSTRERDPAGPRGRNLHLSLGPVLPHVGGAALPRRNDPADAGL